MTYGIFPVATNAETNSHMVVLIAMITRSRNTDRYDRRDRNFSMLAIVIATIIKIAMIAEQSHSHMIAGRLLQPSQRS